MNVNQVCAMFMKNVIDDMYIVVISMSIVYAGSEGGLFHPP